MSCWLIYFYLVGRVLCSITHLPWFHWKGVNTTSLPSWARLWGLSLFGPSSKDFWAWSWFFPHILCWHTTSGCILQWGDAMPFSVSSGYLCLVSIHSDNSRLQLAPSIKCHKLWCQARAWLLPVPQAGKMSACKVNHHFPVIQQHSDSRLVCHLITSFWSSWFSDWHGCSGLCHFWHGTSYSHTRACFVDTVTSLQGSDGGLIAASEVHE